MRPERAIGIYATLVAAIGFANVGCAAPSSKHMADGKEWMTENLRIDVVDSYCYEDSDVNCRRYGRLYTWDSAQRGCASLAQGWRVPTDAEWRALARQYGGAGEDSNDSGKAAYQSLVTGGGSGFNAVLGGDRSDGQSERLEAHGFYWTSSENDTSHAPFYNFGRGGLALNRQHEGSKRMAISVRCVRG